MTTRDTAKDSPSDGLPVAEHSLPLPDTPESLRDQVRSGGVPQDGIPAIDDPVFESADDVGDRLADTAVVFGIEHGGETKAYPQGILVWHEICNDTVGGDPISITYCPLTGTALAFARGSTTFGVSGRLLNNNLVMYDRAAEAWWPQILATSIPSPWKETYERRSLHDIDLTWTTWKRWRTVHPDTTVLTRETGSVRNYDADPYGTYDPPNPPGGYYAPEKPPLFTPLSADDRYPPKTVVIGARTQDGAAAFHKETLREKGILPGTIGDDQVIAVYDSRLETGHVYLNPDESSYRFGNETVVDETGSAHEPHALPVPRIPAFDAMWFAWIGFYPDSGVYA